MFISIMYHPIKKNYNIYINHSTLLDDDFTTEG